MNRNQKRVLFSSVIVFIVIGLYPPWNFVVVIPGSGGVIKRTAGYTPLFSPPPVKGVRGTKIETSTNGTQREKVLNDPKFYALPEKSQVEVLSHFDTEFEHLTPPQQSQILQMRQEAFRLRPTTTPDVEPKTGWPPGLVDVEINWNSLLVEWITVFFATGGFFLYFKAKV